MWKRKEVSAVKGRMNGVPIEEESSDTWPVEKFGCGTTPQAVRCGTQEYTRDCGKKRREGAPMSIGTAKVQRRAGIRRQQK